MMTGDGPCASAEAWVSLGQGALQVVQVVMLAWLARRASSKDDLDHRRWQMNFNEQAKVRRELRGSPSVDHDGSQR